MNNADLMHTYADLCRHCADIMQTRTRLHLAPFSAFISGKFALCLHQVCNARAYQLILASPMHRRVPSWWKDAGASGTKQLYQPEKPVVYIVPITSILGRLSLVPAGDHSTIPAALRGCKRELFSLGKCRVNGLGAFECMVLVLRARQHGLNRGIFCDLGGTDPKTTGRSGGLGGLPKVQPAPPDVWKVSRHGLGAAGPLLLPPSSVGSHETCSSCEFWRAFLRRASRH